MRYETTPPYAGDVLITFPTATDAQIARVIVYAHAAAFLSWKDTSFADRAKIMQRA